MNKKAKKFKKKLLENCVCAVKIIIDSLKIKYEQMHFLSTTLLLYAANH